MTAIVPEGEHRHGHWRVSNRGHAGHSRDAPKSTRLPRNGREIA